MRDGGIGLILGGIIAGLRDWLGFRDWEKSGSGFGQKIARDYGKCTKIWRDIGIKIGNGIGIKKK